MSKRSFILQSLAAVVGLLIGVWNVSDSGGVGTVTALGYVTIAASIVFEAVVVWEYRTLRNVNRG